MKFASATHVGRVRQENEDYVIAKDGVFIVADGMGGHNAGDVASKLAAQEAFRLITANRGQDKIKLLKKVVQLANKKVIDKAYKVQSQSGMGTTLTMAVIDGLTAYIAHVGDSRAYLLHEGKLKQLTEDHSLVAEMVKEGKITRKEARRHPYRNVITKAIGSDPKIKADFFSIALKQGDRLLLSSDGLTGLVKDSEIKNLMSHKKLKTACNQMVKTANDKGGSDNISVILVEIEDNEKNENKLRRLTSWFRIFKFSVNSQPRLFDNKRDRPRPINIKRGKRSTPPN